MPLTHSILGPRQWKCLVALKTLVFVFLQHFCVTEAAHHMQNLSALNNLRRASTVPLIINNKCSETIWPGVLTQNGDGPPVKGFELAAGSSKTFTVSENWQGRVWGRTNCSFDGGRQSSRPCGTGDCGTSLNCIGTGEVPTTLAEFTLNAGDGHSYYDVSLVDGYNLPMAIMMLAQSNSFLRAIPQRLTNPSCVATVGEVSSTNFNPYSGGQSFLGTTARSPLQFESSESLANIAQWCPWNLQLSTLSGPNGGVYIYPDGALNRPAFDPCYSACARFNRPQDCCTGAYNSPSACSPSSYSKAAKAVCPDAYSYAFDDQTSTFIIPSGAGFEIIFCPGGRSTNIIATSENELVQLAQQGRSTTMAKRQTFPQAQEYYLTRVAHNESAIYVNITIENTAKANTSSGRNRKSFAGLCIAVVVAIGLQQ